MEKDTKDLIDALSSGPVKKFIADHEHDDIRKIVLKHKEILGIPTSRLLDQITARKKAKEKLPLYFQTAGVVYPPSENLEQSSSEKTAAYKSDVISALADKNTSVGADLTGGFGVDTYFLSQKVKRFYYVEPDNTLLETARHNHHLLGATNITYNALTAEDFIRTTTERFDFIFIDPSRRSATKGKVSSLTDAKPDVIALANEIFVKTRWLIVKASPLLDIQAGIAQIPFVRQVNVISVSNECKELLFISEKNFSGEVTIDAVNIRDVGSVESFIFNFHEERHQSILFGDPLRYLYEPNASILKAGSFKTVAARFGLQKLHVNTHLYTSNDLLESFPGRKFLVESIVKPVPTELKKYFPDGKGNVTTRNYPLSVDALKKKTGLKDGGEKFLIGFSGQKKKFLVVARRVL